MWLLGEPGVGKTTMAYALSNDLCDEDPEQIQGGPEVDGPAFWGRYQLVAGETRFVDGPLTKALKRDKFLLIEEITLIPPEELATILNLRGLSRVTNPYTNEVLEIGPRFRLVATSNPDGNSCRRNAAVRQKLLDDFHVHEVPALDDTHARAFLQAHFPGVEDEVLHWATQAWEEYRSLATGDKAKTLKLSFRALYHLVQRVLDGEDRHEAIRVALVNKYLLDEDTFEAAKLRHSVAL